MSLNDVLNLLKNPMFIIKLLQLALAITCTAAADRSNFYATDFPKIAFLHTVFCGYIIISAMEVSRIFMGDKTSQILGLFWAAVASVLWLAAAAVQLESYTNMKAGDYYLNNTLTAALVGLLNAIVYMTEFGVFFKWG